LPHCWILPQAPSKLIWKYCLPLATSPSNCFSARSMRQPTWSLSRQRSPPAHL